jgi:stage V sporulation protein G
MEITEVRIGPSDDECIAAYASITIDDCFVVHGLKVKVSKKGDYFLFMPGKTHDLLNAIRFPATTAA